MRALVTGGTGFIGRHVVRELMKYNEITSIVSIARKKNDPETHVYFRDPATKRYVMVEDAVDITDQRQVAETLYFYKPDFIFHLAANAVVKDSIDKPCEVVRANIMGTQHLLAYAKPGTRFCFASSATVYGSCLHTPGTENGPTNPSSIYGATKLAGEALVLAYEKLGHITPLIFRLVANVGPGATHGVVKAIIEKLKSDNPVLELLGDEPGSVKPYTYVGDTARFMVEATLGPPHLRGIVNVSAIGSISVSIIADLVMHAIGIEKPIKWLGDDAVWKGDDKHVQVTLDKAQSLGFTPECGLSSTAIVRAAKELA